MDMKQVKKHEEESVMLLGNKFPLIVTTAVPSNSLLLVSTPAKEDISAISYATHVLEKKFYHQRNTTAGEVESPEKLSVDVVQSDIKLGNRRYLYGITVHASGAELQTVSRQTTSLDGVLIQNLDTKSVTGGRSV